MPAGFQAFNDGYVLQIDGDFKNMTLRHKFYTGLGATINFQAVSPVIVLVPDNASGMFISYANISGVDCNLVLQGYGTGWVYIFDSPILGLYNFGLQVFDGSGNLVFSTSDGYLNVIGTDANLTESFTAGDGAGGIGVTVPAGRRYGVAISKAGYEVTSDYSDVHDAYAFFVDQMGAANNSGLCGLSYYRVWTTDYIYGSGGWPTELSSYSAVLVDVTHIY